MSNVSFDLHNRMMGAIKAEQDEEDYEEEHEEVTKPVQKSAPAKAPAKKEADKSKKPTAEEAQRAYLKAQQQWLEQERKEVEKMKLEAYKLQALNEVGLTLEFTEFINGADEYEIGRNAREFRAVFDRTIERGVAQQLKERGYNVSSTSPRAAAVTTYSNNPFAKETHNLTKQMEIYKKDPAYARQLAAAAGVTVNW